jgi:tRNA pseudouridine32 synthase/23S rRNA pseudouridine746 synthase
MTPEEMVARLLYRDGLMLVIDKPAGLPVHRGPKGAAAKAAGIEGALQDHFDALRFGLPRPPELAHRLDRETAGCLVLGRHRKALATLGDLFKAGKVGKTYWAVVEGGPDADEGTIDLALARRDQSRGWWMKVDPAGQPSLTTWKVMGRSFEPRTPITSPVAGEVGRGSEAQAVGRGVNASEREHYPPPQPSPARGEGAHGASGEMRDKHFTWLALEPVTGRTHQLRVHCQAMGWPILGDTIYGHAPRFGGPAMHLLSREIAVPLYKNKEPVRVTAPAPPQMRDALMACGWTGEGDAAQGPNLTASPPP